MHFSIHVLVHRWCHYPVLHLSKLGHHDPRCECQASISVSELVLVLSLASRELPTGNPEPAGL